ncbi:MAG: hypothetical protein GX058_07605 [Firmicutes bacterium]|nr:hypothetical protein [Bacillota bacterium]
MKIRVLVALSLFLLFAGSVAFAGPSMQLRVGFPADGVYSDFAVGLDLGRIIFSAGVLEASVKANTEKHTYISGDIGYTFGKITPFVAMANVNLDNPAVQVSEGCLGLGIRGQYGRGRVVVDAAGRAFEFQDEINTLLRADLKYRVGETAFLSLGYTRWDRKSDGLFSGFGFGLEMAF